MSMTCHIIEDEPMASKLLQLHVGQLPTLRLIAVSDNPVSALASLKADRADLLFLDVRMPHMTGLALLKMLPDPPLAILTTAFSEFALESYELDVVDYLKKPITFDRFVKAVNKAEQRLQKVKATDEARGAETYMFIKEGTRLVKLNLGEILFIEGLRNYVAIHTPSRKVVSLQRLKALEEQLPADQFIRVHHSYIVAKRAISAIQDNEIV
ncbi:MAG TPA: LytTR family DNA-binding domain-containing protein, partial [Puia sp.]|nr:LytTR family DNA-binding domain-containing protein [Puia sp.]